jgi:hypothetical protein
MEFSFIAEMFMNSSVFRGRWKCFFARGYLFIQTKFNLADYTPLIRVQFHAKLNLSTLHLFVVIAQYYHKNIFSAALNENCEEK